MKTSSCGPIFKSFFLAITRIDIYIQLNKLKKLRFYLKISFIQNILFLPA